MRVHHWTMVIACLLHLCLANCRDANAGDLKPYPLPEAARASIENLAASTNILIFGEFHGTQEVPELVAGLLGPLTKLGYHTLALEVPSNYQASLLKFLRGETERIPNFFAHPNGDGRGNAQLLALARVAASPPFRWQIICFDESESVLETKMQARIQEKPVAKGAAPNLSDEDMIADWRERDATMASNVLKEAKALDATNKILAICGNVHARTTNDANHPVLSKLWPSFAGMLTQKLPTGRVRSVNIEFYSGAYFNDGKIQTFRKRHLEQPVVRSAGQTGWDLVLSMPVARAATPVGPENVPGR